MNHYICTGHCGGIADKEGKCEAPDCTSYGSILILCKCEDGLHNKESETVSTEDQG